MTLAKYIRLSTADEDVKYGDKAESNSVSHQRMLLNSYIERRPEFSDCTVLEFLDDGRSGTNFDRPGLHAMLEAARRYEIDCIIVKDFPALPGTTWSPATTWNRYSQPSVFVLSLSMIATTASIFPTEPPGTSTTGCSA